MSRFQNHQKKTFAKQMFFFVIIFFLIFIFLITLGFKIIINSSLFINQTFNKKVLDSVQKNEEINGILSVDYVPTATNSAKIMISGSASLFDTIKVYLNDEKIKEFEIKPEGFNEEISGLTKGENKLYLVARSKKSKSEKKSDIYNILYKEEKLKIDISEPADNFKTSKQEIKISGKTDKDASIKINGLPVVNASGFFETIIKLKDGENKISVTAQDDFGNSDEKTITVIYQKED